MEIFEFLLGLAGIHQLSELIESFNSLDGGAKNILSIIGFIGTGIFSGLMFAGSFLPVGAAGTAAVTSLGVFLMFMFFAVPAIIILVLILLIRKAGNKESK